MNRYLAVAAGVIAVWLATGAPAQAHGGVQWSVTVNSPGYYYQQPPGVTVWPQSNYIYGAPPSAFVPPPPIVYVAPPYPPPVIYVNPYPYGRPNPWYGGHPRPGWNDWNNGQFRR
ncbi:hypothetical protein EGT07_04900 [Herbaspirillum sp. HC18]|nr:hypothetical protein EGT07_04900 [Herbaspirillum sp. HC18]